MMKSSKFFGRPKAFILKEAMRGLRWRRSAATPASARRTIQLEQVRWIAANADAAVQAPREGKQQEAGG